MSKILYAFLLCLVFTAPAPAFEGLKAGGTAVVAEIVDGDTVVLDRSIDGARQVRLVGIQAPKLPLGRKGFRKWPLADASKALLKKLVLGKTVTLGYGGAPMDRHGRLLAHLQRDDGLWVQGEILSRGLARVYSFPDNRALVADMLAREGHARAAKKGIWGLRYYAVRRPETLKRDIGTFQLIEGRVLDAARVKGTVYLNFGADWRTDFTVAIPSKPGRLFKKLGIDPQSFGGRPVRVRGWLKRRNGPMIEASHPEQIELLPEGG